MNEREARLAEIRLAVTTERADDVLRPIRYKVYRDESYEASNPEVRVLFERIRERETQARWLLAEFEAVEKRHALIQEAQHELIVELREALKLARGYMTAPDSVWAKLDALAGSAARTESE